MLGQNVDEFTVFINTVKLFSNEIAITPSNTYANICFYTPLTLFISLPIC